MLYFLIKKNQIATRNNFIHVYLKEFILICTMKNNLDRALSFFDERWSGEGWF